MVRVEEVWRFGIQAIEVVQRIRNPVLDVLMYGLSGIGSEPFYLLLVCVLLWCGRPGLGFRLAGWLALTGFINADLKSYFAHPRPFEFAPEIALVRTSGYGFPSGHAQAAVVVWGYLAAKSRWRWFWGVAWALILLIGFSRVYLGVHFPTDVVAGWAIGIALLALSLITERLPLSGVKSRRQWFALLGLCLSILATIVVPVARAARPLGLLAGFTTVVLVGLSPWNQTFPTNLKIWRLLSGLSGLLLLEASGRLILSRLFPGLESSGLVAGTFVAGFVLGLWLFLGSFALFERLGLSSGPQTDR